MIYHLNVIPGLGPGPRGPGAIWVQGRGLNVNCGLRLPMVADYSSP